MVNPQNSTHTHNATVHFSLMCINKYSEAQKFGVHGMPSALIKYGELTNAQTQHETPHKNTTPQPYNHHIAHGKTYSCYIYKYIHVHSIQSGHYLPVKSPTAYTKVVEKSKTGDPDSERSPNSPHHKRLGIWWQYTFKPKSMQHCNDYSSYKGTCLYCICSCLTTCVAHHHQS